MMINYTFDVDQVIDPNDNNTRGASKILEIIIKNKYFTSAHLLYAKLKYLMREKNVVMNYIESVLEIDPQNMEAYTLYILINLDDKDYPKARNLINDAQINNLKESREHLYFLILKSKCELAYEDCENAMKTLGEALKIFDNSVRTDFRNIYS